MKPAAEAHGRPRQPGKIRSVLLAVAVHGAFFALIVFGVSWQSRPTPPLQAELWDKIPPGPSTPAPAPAPEPAPEPPKPAPEPPKPAPEPPKPAPEPPKPEVKPEPAKPDPAIAEKKEREKREKKEKERAEQEKKEREKKEQERKDREAKAAAEAKAKAAAEARAKAEAKARAEADAQARAAAEAAVQARQSEINTWRGRIRDKIRGKANVPDTVQGRPEVQVRITILPGGDVLDIVVVRSSGNPVYDNAIERAIRSAQPLPVPSDPELFGQFRSLMLNIQHER